MLPRSDRRPGEAEIRITAIPPRLILSLSILAAWPSMASGQAAAEELEYVLGPLRFPPLLDEAAPLRLVDLDLQYWDARSRRGSLSTRFKLHDRWFIGGEVDSERFGMFVDSARMELGVTRSDQALVVEGAYRFKHWLQRVELQRSRAGGDYLVDLDAAARLSDGVEILLGYFEDFDQQTNQPPSLDEFIETGVLPGAGRPSRLVKRRQLGIRFQPDSRFEVDARLSSSRRRAAGGFDFDETQLSIDSIWNHRRLELSGEASVLDVGGRLARRQFLVGLGAEYRLSNRLVVHGRTRQGWQPGVLRDDHGFSGGVTWYARRHRFARGEAIGERVNELVRSAYALGLNERRVFDPASLRGLRDRLSLTDTREALAESIEALYRAQVLDRQVPQVGVTLGTHTDRIVGVETRTYGLFLGLPWGPRFWLRGGEPSVNFVHLEWAFIEQRFDGGLVATADSLSIRVALNRELGARLSWRRPGRTPLDIANRLTRPSTLSIEFTYALGQ